jgi:hypothetical protein
LDSDVISRRQLIKTGAIVGGTAWVAPAIESFVYKAAAASPGINPTNGGGTPCPPAAAYGLSGLTILYTRNGALYWTFIGEGETACDPGGGSISNDDSFTTACNGVPLTVNVGGKGVTSGPSIPQNDPLGCFFTATAGGATITTAGINAGVKVVAWIAHNGQFVGGTPLGNKGHFEVECGVPNGACPSSPFMGR